MTDPDEMRAQAQRLLDLAAQYDKKIRRADLDHMTPDQINEARLDGRLNHLLNPTQENR